MFLILVVVVSLQTVVYADEKMDGYRAIWYANQAVASEYGYKYSGGLGTYCADHIPLAVYAPKVNKTFFVFGGTKGLGQPKPLLMMASYYDHKTGMVPKPTIVMEKGTSDAHHNPVLSIDGDGHIWVFAPSHGGKDGFIFKSKAPYSVDSFERIAQREFSYPQPWYIDGIGHVFLFTKYTRGRELYASRSANGIDWTPDEKFGGFDGHYQVTWPQKNLVGSSFNWHPPVGGLNFRTNLYYMETRDGGKTWQNAAGKSLTVPLTEEHNDALVRDYQKEGWLVYINDVNFESDGKPVIFYVLAKNYQPGPAFGPRLWMTARWTGTEWLYSRICNVDHNYDMGSIYIEDDGTWRVIGPSGAGPSPYCTGGEMQMWTSTNKGLSWTKVADLTSNSPLTHTYARRPLNAHPDFYAYWADGNTLKPSESRLYFANKTGDGVYVLPEKMTADFERPVLLKGKAR